MRFGRGRGAPAGLFDRTSGRLSGRPAIHPRCPHLTYRHRSRRPLRLVNAWSLRRPAERDRRAPPRSTLREGRAVPACVPRSVTQDPESGPSTDPAGVRGPCGAPASRLRSSGPPQPQSGPPRHTSSSPARSRTNGTPRRRARRLSCLFITSPHAGSSGPRFTGRGACRLDSDEGHRP